VLSLLLLVPFLGAAFVTLIPSGSRASTRCQRIAAIFSWVHLGLLIGWIGVGMDWGKGSLQLREEFAWPLLPGISLTLGVDGLSWLLMVVGTLVHLKFAHQSHPNPKASTPGHWSRSLLALGCLTVALSSTDLYVVLAAWQLLLLLGYFQLRLPILAVTDPSIAAAQAHRYLVFTQAAILGLMLAAATYFQASSASGIEPSANLFDLQSQSGSWKFADQSSSSFAFPIWTLSLQLVCCAVLLGLLPLSFRRPQQQSAAENRSAAGNQRAADTDAQQISSAVPPMSMVLVVYGLLRVVLPLAPDHVAMAAPWVVLWGLIAGARAFLGPNRSDALPALIFALIGLAAWQADASLGGPALDLALLLLILAVTLPAPRRITVAPLAAFVVLYFTTPGIEATLKIVRRTFIGEDLG
jgi:NADH:ubiquinone oxidoreductase subunit 4 (subunit M)